MSLAGGIAPALEAIPAVAGVGEIRGPQGRSLLIGRPANLRRWAATHLGAGKPPRKGSRPPTDLSPIATAVECAATTSSFHQRLVFERRMAQHVSPSARRDLKPPAYLHLDPDERFPRATVRPAGSFAALYGPFRDRRAAARAREALHRLFPLRPCDYVFEPAPTLALGLGCLYAQVRTCAAPCLIRISEADYSGLAREAASFLARPRESSDATEAWLPAWVSAMAGSRGLAVEVGRNGLELYPVLEGSVLEGESLTVAPGDLEAALEGLRWAPCAEPRDDLPWLSAWLHAPRRTGAYFVVAEPGPAALAAAIREWLRS